MVISTPTLAAAAAGSADETPQTKLRTDLFGASDTSNPAAGRFILPTPGGVLKNLVQQKETEGTVGVEVTRPKSPDRSHRRVTGTETEGPGTDTEGTGNDTEGTGNDGRDWRQGR